MEEILKKPLFLFLIIAWTLLWKGSGLWQAAKNNQKYWFIAMLIVNSFGLLEIIYLIWFVKTPKKRRFWSLIINRPNKDKN